MKLLIVANWKMNPVKLQKAEELSDRIKNQESRIKNTELVICPPFVYLLAIKRYSDKAIRLGAQDCFWEEEGAYTGEISPKMLKDLGCKYVIIGHSERRGYLKENNAMINKKLLRAVKNGLNAILCIGEKEGDDINAVLKKQLQRGLEKFPKNKIHLLNIAYEPVWAIGTGKACQPENALVAKILIKRIASNILGRSATEKIRILYGGSVNSKIASSYIKEAEMHGFILGGASLNPKEFVKIINSVHSIK